MKEWEGRTEEALKEWEGRTEEALKEWEGRTKEALKEWEGRTKEALKEWEGQTRFFRTKEREKTHTHYRFTSKFKWFFSPIFKLLSYPPGPPSTYNISIIFQSCVLAYCPRPDYASLSKSLYKGSFKKGFTRKSDFFYPSLVFVNFVNNIYFKLWILLN